MDRTGQTIDFLLAEQGDEHAAKRFLTKALRRHGVPEKITIDGSAAKKAAIKRYNEEHGTAIEIRKITYLNTIVEQTMEWSNGLRVPCSCSGSTRLRQPRIRWLASSTCT